MSSIYDNYIDLIIEENIVSEDILSKKEIIIEYLTKEKSDLEQALYIIENCDKYEAIMELEWHLKAESRAHLQQEEKIENITNYQKNIECRIKNLEDMLPLERKKSNFISKRRYKRKLSNYENNIEILKSKKLDSEEELLELGEAMLKRECEIVSIEKHIEEKIKSLKYPFRNYTKEIIDYSGHYHCDFDSEDTMLEILVDNKDILFDRYKRLRKAEKIINIGRKR